MGLSVFAVGFAAPVAALAGLDPISVFDSPALRTAGVVVGVLGVALTLAAQLGMGDSWRIGVDPGERTALVTGGLFRLSRNPIFSAAILTAAGLAFATGNVIALLGLASLVTALELQVRRVEEPHLRRTHGDAYVTYAAQVGRFVPGVGRLPS
jgi:protein-S-isoprenylcysteine O-methyltransferase Ste14